MQDKKQTPPVKLVKAEETTTPTIVVKPRTKRPVLIAWHL